MIDFFLVDQSIRSQVMETHTRVFRGSELGTDHYLVVVKIWNPNLGKLELSHKKLEASRLEEEKKFLRS